jgi:hypothetical protein
MQLCKTLLPCCGLLQQVFGSTYLWTDPKSQGDLSLLKGFKEAMVANLQGQGLFKKKPVKGFSLLSAVRDCNKEAIEATLLKRLPEGQAVTPPFHCHFTANTMAAFGTALLFALTEARMGRKISNLSEVFVSEMG